MSPKPHPPAKNQGRSSRENYTLENKRLSKTEEDVLIEGTSKPGSQDLSASLPLAKDMADTISEFLLVKNTINKYGILPEDTYNFGETASNTFYGFGLATARCYQKLADCSAP
ncbi:hypothetical protein LTR49_018029 [Elasticomyces elasticus]|nr:hypothetical protein LTR49_018029 [Elasticomyces elasticus]